MQNALSDYVKVKRVANASAAGTSDVDSSSVDLSGAESVMFMVLLGALTSTNVTTIKLQESDDDSTFTDVTNGSVATVDTEDNQLWILDYHRAKKRYVRIHMDRDTANAVVDGITAQIYGVRSLPVTNDATVQSVTKVVGY